MNKKFTSIIILITLFIPFSVFANVGQCKIKNGPAPELLEYLKNIRKIISNTTKEIITSPTSPNNTKDYGKAKSLMIGIYNKSISWEGYYSTWNYYVIAPMTEKEIPYEIRRDHKLIEKEIDSLSKYLDNLISNSNSDITIQNTCNGVNSNNCNLNGMKSKDVISELLQDTTALANTYRLHVLGKKSSIKIKFGGPNFSQIWNYYNEKTVEACSNEDGEGKMLKNIKDAWEKIKNISLGTEDGIKLWTDAVDLMLGRNPDNYNKTEKALLKNELSRQGVNTTNSDIVMGNLAKYNAKNGDGGYSEKNNFIGNSFNSMNKNLSNQYDDFKKNIFDPLKPGLNPTQNQGKLKKSIKDIIDLGQKNDITTSIVTRIVEIYQSEAPFSRLEDTNTQKLQGKLIDMHIQLTSSINILDKTISISEKVCNSQDYGNGKCTTK